MLLETIGTLLTGVVTGYLGLKLFYPWVLTDINYLIKVVPGLVKYQGRLSKRQFLTEIFEEQVERYSDKTFILYEKQKYSYREVNEKANRIARMALTIGIEKGDTVTFMQHTGPHFVWTFLGFLKVGIRLSLINTNLRGKTLLHCITVSNTKRIFIGDDPDFAKAIVDILPSLPDVVVYVQGPRNASLPESFVSMDTLLAKETCEKIDPKYREEQQAGDICCFIFTSGTTGLPKAAKITLKKIVSPYVFISFVGWCADDIIYITLPMYHSSAAIIGLGGTILTGSTCALAKKFSKTNFFKDVRQHGATVFLYIGEMCRYLLTTEKSELDTKHSVRLAIGNGLRHDIFKEFQQRFEIPKIAEFYAATEGATGFVNAYNIEGSCGRSSPILEKLITCGLYEWDVEHECLVRDDNGRCIPVPLGRPGLLLIQINKLHTFEGYSGQKEMTEHKIVRNVVKEGDMFFNTGDLMYKDKEYNMYFSDRTGDTFRWKGENVSTTEVSNLLTEIEYVLDACVYGVAIPGHDGKAGMATLLFKPGKEEITEKELSEISQHCQKVLPAYAVPVFLRIKWDELELTSTIKQTKVKLKQEGFDYWIVGDPLFYYDRSSKTYKQLTKESYEDVMNQTIGF